jgi:predicted transcriptional regulator
MTDISDLEIELEKKEREIKNLLAKIDKEKKEQQRIKEAKEYFYKNFKLSMISDNFNIYPQEIYNNVENKFINNFVNDKGYIEHLITELREEYISSLKSDINTLTEFVKEIEAQFKNKK